mgnify:FL=1|jgi:hypothetical protein
MNHYMESSPVLTIESLLINDEIVTRKTLRAHGGAHPNGKLTGVTRENQVRNEELVLTNIMRNNHRLTSKSRILRLVRRTNLARGTRKQASFTQ